MKNKTIKTLAYLLAGLSLSACAGAGADETATTGEAGEAITVDDLEAVETPLSTNGVGYNFLSSSSQSWTGGCLGNCVAFYPDVIGITPLADNTGTATYSGSVHVQFNNRLGTTTDRVTDATFKVNFDENEILYDGTIGNLALQIRADFTPRGLITGTLSLDRNDSYLLGVIGQTEMAGAFTTRTTSDVGFAGGFTASRD